MKISFIKKHGALFPLYDEDKEKFNKISEGEILQRKFTKLRNPEFHKLVFSFLNVVFRYQDKHTDFDEMRKEIKRQTGCYTHKIIVDNEKKTVVELEYLSWSFDKMDDFKFQEEFKKIKDYCWKEFIPNADPQVVETFTQELLAYG
jgi:hypothetical protein